MRKTVDGYECFGDTGRAGKLERCSACQFFDSCMLCADNPDSTVNSRLSRTVSYDKVAERAEEIADDGQEETPRARRPTFGWEDVRKVVQWLLSMDDYTVDVLARLCEGEYDSASALAKAMGVRRQAIHRKLVDACAEHPELSDTLRQYLPKCRRIMEHRKTRRNRQTSRPQQTRAGDGRQMEFKFE